MGKKGKKSRRQAKKVDTDKIIFDNISKRIDGLWELSTAYVDKKLLSDAAANLRVAIQFLKTKNKALLNIEQGPSLFYNSVLNLCNHLLWLELGRCNFEAVMEVYNYLKDILSYLGLEIGNDWVEEEDVNLNVQTIQFYYELALVTTKNSNSNTSWICEFLLRQMATAPVDATVKYLERAGNVLRVAKKFDQVIDLDQKLLLLPNLQESLEVKVSLAVSYIERYREEYHLRSKRGDYLLVKFLLNHIWETYEYYERNICKLSFELALAQWQYLCHKLSDDCHKLSDEKHKQLCYEHSIRHIETIVEIEWNVKDDCSTCGQAPTKDDVKYVCSGCRVSCYCSIDHQRINWRKCQIPGTCVGHKTFCPVLKAYRKWKVATNESTIDEEKQGRMRRRFERECLDFLAYGLSLEKKCFGVEDTRTE